ncbi:hypothetical protein V8G54_008121 [Vigna mungo]|uniref:Uncharacterized protein n=1 Tax=Vigna mungo TaxID=3915 RepID=A0AAQ3S640_VIGMU
MSKTCSALMRYWSLSLSKGPQRPPLRGLMKTTIGTNGATALESSSLRTRRLSPAASSLYLMESRIADRRYCGIVNFCLSSSLHRRGLLEMPQPRKDSTIADDDDDNESIVFALRSNIRRNK